MYYCEEFGYYVNSPDCGMCHLRHDCEVREEKEGARQDENDETDEN